MKKILFFAIASIMIACSPATKTYIINGTVVDIEDGKEVYLTDLASGVNLDTAVIAQSKFSFEGNLDTNTIARVVSNRKAAMLVLQEGVINVTLSKKSNISGTVLNDKLETYTLENRMAVDSFNAYVEKVKLENPDKIELQSDLINKYYTEIYTKAVNKNTKSLLESNKGNILAVYAFSSSISSETTVADIDAFILTNPLAATFAPIQKAKTAMINLEKTSPGMMFTDFTVRNIENTADVKLSDYVGQGKYVLVDFWASWCGPCKREIPNLKGLHDKFGEKMLILGVNVWDKHDAALKSIKDFDMNWTNIYGSDSKLPTDLYGIKGIPTIILFAPDGTIVDRKLRGDKMVEYVTDLMTK